MVKAVFEVKAKPKAPEADGDTYFVTAESAPAAAAAVQAQLGSTWIVEAVKDPVSDQRAQQLRLTDGNPKLG